MRRNALTTAYHFFGGPHRIVVVKLLTRSRTISALGHNFPARRFHHGGGHAVIKHKQRTLKSLGGKLFHIGMNAVL